MANCEINGKFTDQIPKWDRKTRADGNEMGGVIELLVNNDVNLKKRAELMAGERQAASAQQAGETARHIPRLYRWKG